MPRLLASAALTVIAISGRLVAIARRMSPPSASPSPRRVASTSVVSESLIPAYHTASAARAKTATTAGSGRPDTGGKDTKRRGHRPGAARIGACTARVALVSGGGTGIGAATARRLAAAGVRVAVMGRRREPVERVAAEIGGLALVGDSAAPADAERAVAAVTERTTAASTSWSRTRAETAPPRRRTPTTAMWDASAALEPDEQLRPGPRGAAGAHRALRLHRHRLVGRGALRDPRRRGLHGLQARPRRAHPVAGPRLRAARRPGERGLPGVDADPGRRRIDGPAGRAARARPRGGLRALDRARPAAPARHRRRGRRGVRVPRLARGVGASPAPSSRSTAARASSTCPRRRSTTHEGGARAAHRPARHHRPQPCPRSAWAGTSSAGPPTRTRRSRCSTPTRRRAATSSTPPTATATGSRATRAAMSERIIGRWMAARGNRDDLVIATKVGRAAGMRGLAAATIRAGAEASLERLATDRIDLYYAHADDPEHAARGDDGGVRRARPRGQGAPPRRLELHGAAPRRGASR